MAKSDHGISLDDRNQEQPSDKKRARDSSSRNIPDGHGSADTVQPRQIDDGAPRESEDDIQESKSAHEVNPGKPDPAKMTPQLEKKTPKDVDPGHLSKTSAARKAVSRVSIEHATRVPF